MRGGRGDVYEERRGEEKETRRKKCEGDNILTGERKLEYERERKEEEKKKEKEKREKKKEHNNNFPYAKNASLPFFLSFSFLHFFFHLLPSLSL